MVNDAVSKCNHTQSHLDLFKISTPSLKEIMDLFLATLNPTVCSYKKLYEISSILCKTTDPVDALYEEPDAPRQHTEPVPSLTDVLGPCGSHHSLSLEKFMDALNPKNK